ncbi:MAG: hypothetical protein K1X37_11445, partial [Saprospiraceae bacterium]|nr:hypothetical protein [Saprospiraceae bacterium]
GSIYRAFVFLIVKCYFFYFYQKMLQVKINSAIFSETLKEKSSNTAIDTSKFRNFDSFVCVAHLMIIHG